MPRSGAIAIAIALAATLPAVAQAKASLQGQVALSGGWTDNVLSVPDFPPPGQKPPESDFYFELRPSLILTAGVPRAVQRLAYVFTADLFATHSEADSYNHRLEWSGFFLPSKTTELTLTASFVEGRQNNFNLQTSSALVDVAALPPGGVTFIGVNAGEQLGAELTQVWRFNQSLAFNAYIPIDPTITPQTYSLDNHLGAERSWQRDALGADVRTNFIEFTQVPGVSTGADGQIVTGSLIYPERRVLIDAASARWRHDFGHWWNLELDGGVVESSLTNGGSVHIDPLALLALRFLHVYGNAELSFRYDTLPNPQIAQVYSAANVSLRGAVPLGLKSHVTLATTVGYLNGRIIDFETNGTLGTTQVVVADTTLTWAPRPEIQIYLRYSFFDQFGNVNDPSPQQSFLRHNILLGLIATWPAQAAAIVPSRQALRVDRGDAVEIPELHQEPPKTRSQP
jgi:hypothetical protein